MRIISILLSLLCFFSCERRQDRQNALLNWFENNGKVKVLSTTGMINDLVKDIGGDKIDTLPLIIGELDPHSYQLVKGDDEKIDFADIIFFNGLNLEHGPSLKKSLYHKKNAYGLGDFILKNNPNELLYLGQVVDPHIWMDVSLFSKTIPYIVAALSEKDPINKEFYEERGKKVKNELENLHGAIIIELKKVPLEKRFLVTSHDAFNYFAKAYLATDEERKNNSWIKRFQAPEGLAPDSQLSLQDISFIIQHLKENGIEIIFPESNISQNSLRKILDVAKIKGQNLRIANCSLYADAMGPKGSSGETYKKMMLYDAKVISSYLFPDNGEVMKCH